MADWKVVDNELGIPSITDVLTSVPSGMKVGDIVKAKHETYGTGEFIFLAGVASTAAGDVVSYNGYTGATTRWAGTAGTGAPLAVAMAATVASTYGFYQISGNMVVNISGTVAAGDKAFWQATAVVSTTQVNGKQVLNMVAVTANGVPSTGKAVYSGQRIFAQGQIV